MSDGLPSGKAVESVTLSVPTSTYAKVRKEIRFTRRLKAGDLVWVGEQSFDSAEEKNLLLIHKTTGWPTDDLEELDAYDFNKACGVIAGFMLRGPRTGKKSSGSSESPSPSEEATS